MTILESQVVELEEDLTVLDEDFTGLEVDLTELDEYVDFLFDEQIIQDERLLTLEQENDIIDDELESEFSFLPAAMKLGQGNVFTGVCDSVHRVSVSVIAGILCSPPPNPGADPSEQTPPGADAPPQVQTHPRADTSRTRTPRPDTPLQSRHTHPAGSRHTPPPEADVGIRLTRGRYASYWNAFLFKIIFTKYFLKKQVSD